MSIFSKGYVRVLTMGAALALAGGSKLLASETAQPQPSANDFSLTPHVEPDAKDSTPAAKDAEQPTNPMYLDDAASPNVHGFLNVPFKSAYVTPRGLVVENAGLVFQPIIGLIFTTGDLGPLKDTAIVTGIWTSFNTAQGDPKVGCWNEVDYFATFSGKVGDFSFAATFSPWFFPQATIAKPDTEYTADLKVTYNDHWIEGWSINPYTDLFWSIGGSSNVVLGDNGGTGYVELGVVPTKTVTFSGTPLTFTFPTYFSVGPKGYWDSDHHGGDNFGLFSISANLSMPINAIPVQYGHWHFDAGVTYDYLINDALLEAGDTGTGAGNVGWNWGEFLDGVSITAINPIRCIAGVVRSSSPMRPRRHLLSQMATGGRDHERSPCN
jgi:hypothetical protein